MEKSIEELTGIIEPMGAEEILRWAGHYFGAESFALASSLGAEDQVLTDMLLRINPKAIVLTLDTGRLPQETYSCMQETMKRYSMKYRIYFPEKASVEALTAEKGPDLFYDSVENRIDCCRVRKVEPLKRALAGLAAWVCGLRREQALTRSVTGKIEWDENNRMFKLNPLGDWPEEKVWNYIRKHRVPYNKLHDQGYPSIGCAPCTRAVKPGEDIRAGRWWWESPEKKECGLHRKNGKLGRKES